MGKFIGEKQKKKERQPNATLTKRKEREPKLSTAFTYKLSITPTRNGNKRCILSLSWPYQCLGSLGENSTKKKKEKNNFVDASRQRSKSCVFLISPIISCSSPSFTRVTLLNEMEWIQQEQTIQPSERLERRFVFLLSFCLCTHISQFFPFLTFIIFERRERILRTSSRKRVKKRRERKNVAQDYCSRLHSFV